MAVMDGSEKYRAVLLVVVCLLSVRSTVRSEAVFAVALWDGGNVLQCKFDITHTIPAINFPISGLEQIHCSAP
jgi:hypothetical protein